MGKNERESYGCAMVRPLMLGVAVALTLLIFAAQPAAAVEIHARINLVANSNPVVGPQQPINIVREQTVQDPVGAIQKSLQAGSGLAGSAAHVIVGLGGIRVNAFSDAVADPAAYIFSASDMSAFGSFTDELTITSPSVANGQPGTATFAVHVEGFLAHGFMPGNTSAVARATWVLNGSFFSFLSYDTDYIDDVFEFDVNFIYGDPFPIDISMESYASAAANAGAAVGSSAFGSADFGNTLEWMGTVDVTDNIDQDVTDYSMTSASGTDYRNAIEAPEIPEPASAALFSLVGVGFLFCRTRRVKLKAPTPTVALLLLACAGTQRASAAEIYAEVVVGPQSESQTVSDPAGSITQHLNALGGVSDAQVGLGWMRLNAFADALVIEQFVNHITGTADAVGRFDDEITIVPDNPALIGQPGTATFGIRIAGFVAAGGSVGSLGPPYYSGIGSASAVGYFNGDQVFQRTAFFPSEDIGAPFNEIVEVTLNVIFGDPQQISLRMMANAAAGFDDPYVLPGDASFGESDLGNTIEWMGAVRVADEVGNQITDYELTSPSGTDYRNPIEAPEVPEPASLALLTGFCVIFLRRSRRN